MPQSAAEVGEGGNQQLRTGGRSAPAEGDRPAADSPGQGVGKTLLGKGSHPVGRKLRSQAGQRSTHALAAAARTQAADRRTADLRGQHRQAHPPHPLHSENPPYFIQRPPRPRRPLRKLPGPRVGTTGKRRTDRAAEVEKPASRWVGRIAAGTVQPAADDNPEAGCLLLILDC